MDLLGLSHFIKHSLLRTNGQLSDLLFKLWEVSYLPYLCEVKVRQNENELES